MQKINSLINYKRFLFVFITTLLIGYSGWSQKIAYIDKNYKKITKDVKLINAQLDKNALVLDSLNSTLQKLFVHRDTLQSDQDVLKTVLKTSNENLVKLGPVPEDGAPKESAAISKGRN